MSKKIKTSDMYYERWNSMIEFVNTVRHRDLSPNWIGKNCGVVMDGAHRSCHGDLLTGTDDIVRPMKFYARPDGCKYSYEETIDYCINGTDMFNDMIGHNKYKIPFSMAVAPRKQKNNNIAGQQVNVPRYLNNTPANMLMSREQDKPKQAINIVFDTDCNWTTPVINRVQCGVNILKAVQALTIAGYDVQLDVMPFCSYSKTTSKLYMTTIRLKDYGENVNMNRLAYPIAAVASQFHLGVDWMQRIPDSPYMLAAGWPVYPNEKRYDEIKDYFKNKHDAFFIGLHEMNLLEADKDTDKSVDNLIQYLTGNEVERKGGYKTGYAVKQAGGSHIRAYNDEFMDFNENIDDAITETPEFDNPDANNTKWSDDFKEADGIMNENHENIIETNGTSESNRDYNSAQTNNDITEAVNDIGLNADRNDSNQNESEKNNTADSIDGTESDNTVSADDKQDSMDASHSYVDDESSHELTDRQNNNVQDTDNIMDNDMNPSNSESNSQQDDSNESTVNNTEHDDEQSGSDNETDENMNTGSIKQDSDNETDESSNAQSDSNSESSNHADEQSGKQIDSNSDNSTASQDTDSTEQHSGNSQNKGSKNEPQSDNGEQNQNDDSNTSSDSEQQCQDSQSDNQDESASEQNQNDSDSQSNEPGQQSNKQDDSNKSNDNTDNSQEQDDPESNDDINEPEQDMNDEITLDDVLNGNADGAPLKYDYESFIEWLKRVYDWLQKANRK